MLSAPYVQLVNLPLRKIRLNSNVRGICVSSAEHKLSAYADNVLFYVSQTSITFPILMSELQHFGHLSKFHINVNKSEILPITIPFDLMS